MSKVQVGGGRRDEGVEYGVEKEAQRSCTDQNSPSSILCSSCFWISGDTSSHSTELEQR